MDGQRAFLACFACWLVFWGYWLYAMQDQKAARRLEPGNERGTQVLAMIAAYVLLLSPLAARGWLATRVLPRSTTLDVLGIVTTALGVAFTIWARWHLGTNWSARVSIRADHELIRSGPYRLIRHPIYTGILLAAIGTMMVVGQVRAPIAVVIFFAEFSFKARKEERWLAQEFGARFTAHAKETGMFWPRMF